MSLLFGDLFDLGAGVDLFDVGGGNLFEAAIAPCVGSEDRLFESLFCLGGVDLFDIDPDTNVFDLTAPIIPCSGEDYLFSDLFCLGDGSDLFDVGGTNVFLLQDAEPPSRPHHGGNRGKRRQWRYDEDELLMLRLRADDEALLAIVFAFLETAGEDY